STGMDRNDFPKLPTVGGESGIDPVEFSEFNEILLKACDPSLRSRYQTAGELFGDLVLLQSGKSVRRIRRLEKQAAFLFKVGIAGVILATLATAAYFGSFKQFERARSAEQRAIANVELLEMQKSEDLFQRDDSSSALAYLAHVVRSNPTNHVAAERLMSALTWRNFVLPSAEPMTPESRTRVLQFNPNGKEVVSGSFNGSVQFWDSQTGDLTWEFKAANRGIFDLHWAPDRQTFIVGAFHFGLIYDSVSRQPITTGFSHWNRVNSVRYSPDQRWILTGSYDGTARIWNSRTAEPTDRIFSHEGRVRLAIFSPDGRYVATAGMDDASARIWDAATGRPVSARLRHNNRVNDVAFSPDGNLLVTASDDGTAQLWHAPEGRRLGGVHHKAQVSDAIFSPDGTKLATTSEDDTAVLWDVETLKQIGDPMRHRGWIKDVHFSPDGLILVTASEDNTTRIWDGATAQPLSEPMRHPQAVESVAFSPVGERMATAVSSTTESSLWLWKTTPRGAMSRPFKISGNKRSAHLVRQTGQLCIADGQSLRIWPSVESKAEPTVIDFGVAVDFFKLTADGTRCVVVSANNAWVWDLSSRQQHKGPLWHTTEILGADFSPDHSRLAVATAGGHLTMWHLDGTTDDPDCQQLLPQPGMAQPTRDDGAFAVHFSPDGRLVLAACRNGKARIFDARTAELLVDLQHKHWVLSAEFSPDGRRIITASYDRYAKVWDTATGEAIGQPLHHDNDVLSGCFSPDGRRVVTTSRDWTARVWDAQTGRPVSEPLRHSGPVLSACFGPDGVRVATGSADETARIWDAEIGQPLTDPFRYSGPVQHVEFTTDGSGLLVVPATGDVQLIDVLQVRLPTPSWLPDLAEAVARQRLNERQMTEPVSAEQFFRLKRELNSLPDSALNVHWAKWFMADPAQRPISPNSTIGLGVFRDGLLRAGTKAALRRAIRLDPTDALAHARLAQLLVSPEQTVPSPRDISEARWHERYARKLQPESRDVSRLCDIVESRISALNLPTTSAPERR
ncbi:MAG TPA: hypothetical protein VJS65_16220, partial [Verrucomicrobiae bacterium]|nr:hypothetical protein [Verrucomicrobiae bacterium]